MTGCLHNDGGVFTLTTGWPYQYLFYVRSPDAAKAALRLLGFKGITPITDDFWNAKYTKWDWNVESST